MIFRVEAPHSWPADLTIRVRHQFDIFGLPSLYSSEAAREISNIRHNLQTHFDAGGTGAVQNELMLYRTRFLGHKFVSCGGPE